MKKIMIRSLSTELSNIFKVFLKIFAAKQKLPSTIKQKHKDEKNLSKNSTKLLIETMCKTQ